jgi:dUTP pyrophosphatase
MEVRVKRIHPDAKLPTYGSDAAACFDLYAVHDGYVDAFDDGVANTGLAFEVPEGYALMVYSRSGHGFHHRISLVNSVGVCDADFRGSVQVGLRNDSPIRFRYCVGDRIAQAMVVPVPKVTFVEVDSLTETVRGIGGFGSTGA